MDTDKKDTTDNETEKKTPPGLYRNPLNKSKLRNMPCICGSGKKIKKCHGIDYGIDVLKLNEINRLIDKHNKAIKDAIREQNKAP